MPVQMTYQVYNVPTVPSDLRREETVRQIADALEYLDKVSNDVFSKINSRVTENKARLQKLDDRVALAQAKVDKLKGSSKATKVFASAKFPAVDDLEFYHSVFRSARDSGIQKPKRTNYHIQSKHQSVDDRVLREKFQYYNVHLAVKKKKKNEDEQGEGLGALPRQIPSVSSLLLFNTSENPYQKYVMLDPLGAVTKTRTALVEEEAGLADAPSTIAQQEELHRQQQESFFYMPDIGQVPEIMVPDFLPDLLGVANDLSYSADQGPSIAPSVLGTGTIPDLPSVLPESEDIPPGPITQGAVPSSAPPPPPGPPPPAAPPPPSAPPPPPPPPPPPSGPPPAAPPVPPVGDEVDSSTPTPAPAASSSDGRGDLLASIRNAGGAGKAMLKNAKDRKLETKKKKEQEKGGGGGGGGDLMSDLFAKLTMRRKGISGSGKTSGGGTTNDSSDNHTTGGGSAMDKISSMIPSPPRPGGEEDGHDEEDWD